MRVIEYFTSEDKERWLNELKKCDWEAGQFLHQLLSENKLKQTVGQTALVLMLVDGDRLISFCTFAPMDDIQPTKLSPWIGFLYTFPEYRGNKYAGTLLDYAESLATVMEREYTYISTNHVGLYEKYGYEFYKMEKDIWGEDTRVYRKNLTIEGEDKTRRLENGAKWKGQIVKDAKEGTDMVAYCGFYCNNCFLGEWCGGCRSAFCCCSYGSLFAKGICPNVLCCQEKSIDGCYECDELQNCTKGFYGSDNSDASACKAQGMFIKKYGKDKFIRVHDNLFKEYEDKKAMQEALGKSVEEGLKILEEQM